MGKHFIACLILFYANNLFAQDKQTPFNIGEIVVLHSSVLLEDRTLNIYLPEGFDKDSTYSVMYLLDGSANEDFVHIVGLVQFFNMMQTMPKTIVVGIANVDRKRDFTHPTTVKELTEKYPTTGYSEKFMRFIEQELQIYIEKRYNTNGKKYLIGQSLGGLLASEILLKKPNLFTDYIIISPSLWWDNQSLLKQAPNLVNNISHKTRIYISVGSEGNMMKNVAKKLRSVLKHSGKKNLSVDFVPLPKENHATILHASVYEAFKILFPYKD